MNLRDLRSKKCTCLWSISDNCTSSTVSLYVIVVWCYCKGLLLTLTLLLMPVLYALSQNISEIVGRFHIYTYNQRIDIIIPHETSYPFCLLLFSNIHVIMLHRWQRHQMETFYTLLTLCAGNSPVIGEIPSQMPVTRSFDAVIDLRPNKRLSKPSRRRWFEMPSRSLWRHCNDSPRLLLGHWNIFWQLFEYFSSSEGILWDWW